MAGQRGAVKAARGSGSAVSDNVGRLVVVYSETSSQYKAVERDVLTRVRGTEFDGVEVVEYSISKYKYDENVARIGKMLRDGDVVIATGGDGTASVAANGALVSERRVVFAALPYGNFNDLARTLKISGFDDIFKVILRLVKTGNDEYVKKLYPLEIWVDNKLWRYAPCYVTIGMVAEACELFDREDVRAELHEGHTKMKPYEYMAQWFFENRRAREFLPEFRLNGVRQHKGTSDYAAVNARSMARVMKGGDDYLKPKVFRSVTDKLTSLPRLTMLMTRAIIMRTPGAETTGDVLEFMGDGEVEIQAEGEYEKFKNPRKIEIKKGEKWIKVIQL